MMAADVIKQVRAALHVAARDPTSFRQMADGSHGPDRYIEAQVWSDAPLRAWLPAIPL